jgi:hypothetical protein
MTSRFRFWRLAFAGIVVAAAVALPSLPAVASTASQAGAAATACATSRPHSGTFLFSAVRGGMGQMTIKNHINQDVVVVMVRGKTKAVAVYVRAKANYTVRNVKSGLYTVFFTTGSLYSVCKERFTHDAAYWRVKGHVTFVVAPFFTVATLTLFVANGGSPSASQINPSGFPVP